MGLKHYDERWINASPAFQQDLYGIEAKFS